MPDDIAELIHDIIAMISMLGFIFGTMLIIDGIKSDPKQDALLVLDIPELMETEL